MKKHLVVTAVLIGLATPGWAQEQKAASASATGAQSTLKVQLVLSRYQGDRKISSFPYTLMVHADERNRNTGRANLRLGSQVPITTMSRQSSEANAPLVPTTQYRDVGTSIDCTITALDGGRYKVDVTVEDSSIDNGPASGATGANPAFRTFKASDSMLLRDGQSAQSSTATDKVSGDVWRVDVTLTVVK